MTRIILLDEGVERGSLDYEIRGDETVLDLLERAAIETRVPNSGFKNVLVDGVPAALTLRVDPTAAEITASIKR